MKLLSYFQSSLGKPPGNLELLVGLVMGSTTTGMAGDTVVGQDPSSEVVLPVPAQRGSQGPVVLLQHLKALWLGTT